MESDDAEILDIFEAADIKRDEPTTREKELKVLAAIEELKTTYEITCQAWVMGISKVERCIAELGVAPPDGGDSE